jgi:GNAT superfamily N-acetyltransferase
MGYRIVSISERPDLAPLVAAWRMGAFGHPGGWTIDDVVTMILAPPMGPEETFVLFEESRPVGTASLAHEDLETRPDLTPWLAGVYVEPAFRGRGHGTALVRQVEAGLPPWEWLSRTSRAAHVRWMKTRH